MIQLFNIKLERITSRGYRKLHPLLTEVIDVRIGETSIHDSIIQYQTRKNNITRISETPSTSNRSDRC